MWRTKYDMPLFVDGARLGYALTTTGSDMTLADLATIADVFYIGGTKVGALFGEAVVFTKHNTPKHFLTLIKQHGALLAKGFVLGAQFDALFTDNLYFKIARNANEAADRIREALRAKGYTLTFEAPTNQIFRDDGSADHRPSGARDQARLYRKGRRHAHRDAHLHQLGHHA